MIDGLNPRDPGVGLLGDALAEERPEGLLLVHCGDLPGLRPGATRLVLDVREVASSPHRCLALAPGELPGDLPDARPGAGGFEHAAVWPRAHLGKDFVEVCLAIAALAVRTAGSVHLATRRAKGGASLEDFAAGLLGPGEVCGRRGGYRWMRFTRAATFDVSRARAILGTRYEIVDPRLGERPLRSGPGVFSRRALDAGTRALLEYVESRQTEAPQRVLDLGAGVGPLSMWAAERYRSARVLAVESNRFAAWYLAETVRERGLGERFHVAVSDGLKGERIPPAFGGPFDLVLCNPPTHAPEPELATFFEPLPSRVRPGAPAYFVAARPRGVARALERTGAEVVTVEGEGYGLLEARWS